MRIVDQKREAMIGDLIIQNSYKVLAEIGVYRGRFTKYLFNTKPTKLYLVDPWRKFSADVFPDYKQYGQKDWDDHYLSVKAKYSHSNVEIIRATSEEAAKQINPASLDLAYIDGNHTYDFVKKDLKLWAPKVKGDLKIGLSQFSRSVLQRAKWN